MSQGGSGESIKEQYYTAANREGFVMMARTDLILKGHLAMRSANKEVASAAKPEAYQAVYVRSTVDAESGEEGLSVRGSGSDVDGASICGGCCKKIAVGVETIPLFRHIVDSNLTIGTVAHSQCAPQAANLLCFFGQLFDQVQKNV